MGKWILKGKLINSHCNHLIQTLRNKILGSISLKANPCSPKIKINRKNLILKNTIHNLNFPRARWAACARG